MEKHGKRKEFFTGGNSTCRQYSLQHYKLYKAKFKEAGIPEHHRTIPWEIWREMEKAKNTAGQVKQGKLNGIIQKITRDPEFS